MHRLDPAIDRLYRESGLELVLQTGAVPYVTQHRGKVPLLKHAVSTAQVIQSITELAPEAMKASFPREGTTRFAYAAPAGAVQVRFDKWGDRVRATITPAPAGAEEAHGMAALIGDESQPAADLETGPLELAGETRGEREAARKLFAAPGATADLAGVEAPEPEVKPVRPVVSVSYEPQRPRGKAAPVAEKPATPPTLQPAATGGLKVLPMQHAEGWKPPEGPLQMETLLSRMLQRNASDLHLTSENLPMFRIDGDMTAEPVFGVIGPGQMKDLLFSIAPERNREEWEQKKDTDFAHETPEARFRVNLFADRKGIGAVIRQIPATIKTAEELGLSKAILDLCHLPKGLVLVTGPTGSGKSTTLAAMIDHINRTRSDHIITIEDPIEFVHPNRSCLVNQREVGVHTGSFKNALRAALREDPDVVLVGELRDLETIAIAIETAETGHLVFGTLHTNTAPSTVDRIIDQFPSDRQQQIRTMLSESLKGVVTQTLCKKIGGGRAAAQEVLLCNGGVSNIIREGKTFQLPSLMQTGRAQGMVTLNDALLDLVKRNVVAPEEALKKSAAKSELKASFERAGIKLEAAVGETRAA